MYEPLLSELHRWFDSYTDVFVSGDEDRRTNILLKKDHTKQVCAIILRLGKELGLSGRDLFIAELTALFHDIGRFEQYARYGTYMDSHSENHAELGLTVLAGTGALSAVDKDCVKLVLESVRHHNLHSLPSGMDKEAAFFTKLVRDADKIDVLRIVVDFYTEEEITKKIAAKYGMPNTPVISDEVYDEARRGTLVSSSSVKTWADNKLLHLAWVYDINFVPTFRLLKERGYLRAVYDTMPRTEKTALIYKEVVSYMERKIEEGR